MIVLKKIGTRSEIEIKHKYKTNEYIHSDSYLLTGFEYSAIKDISKENIEYHMVWNECNTGKRKKSLSISSITFFLVSV